MKSFAIIFSSIILGASAIACCYLIKEGETALRWEYKGEEKFRNGVTKRVFDRATGRLISLNWRDDGTNNFVIVDFNEGKRLVKAEWAARMDEDDFYHFKGNKD